MQRSTSGKKRSPAMENQPQSSPPNSTDSLGHGLYLKGLAMASQKRWFVAVLLYRSALSAQRKDLGDNHLDVARTWNDLGVALAWTGNVTSAERAFEEALRIRRKELGAHHMDAVQTAQNIWMLRNRGPPKNHKNNRDAAEGENTQDEGKDKEGVMT